MGPLSGHAGVAGALAWAVAGRALPGETESGDGGLVLDRGADVLVAVVDGLGHGPAAAAAARAACSALAASRADLEGLFLACHRTEERERGVAMSAALVAPDGSMSWAGVGNVEGLLVRAPPEPGAPRAPHERLLMRGGVVGGSMPPIRQSRLELRWGDTLVLATDGVSEELAQSCDAREPEALAQALLARYARPTDDALVLVARFLGGRG
ncbi:MAG TPA: SpoIIE family protein phosphatase [Myxococcales bacterium]|nr:SpoIIE family protein phosphatase [Myxococcales bacterium]